MQPAKKNNFFYQNNRTPRLGHFFCTPYTDTKTAARTAKNATRTPEPKNRKFLYFFIILYTIYRGFWGFCSWLLPLLGNFLPFLIIGGGNHSCFCPLLPLLLTRFTTSYKLFITFGKIIRLLPTLLGLLPVDFITSYKYFTFFVDSVNIMLLQVFFAILLLLVNI